MSSGRSLKRVITYHLELTDPSQFRAATARATTVTLRRVAIPCPALNRFFYTGVGRNWYWIDRLKWSDRQWIRYLMRPELTTWIATSGQTPIGYCELESQGPDVEIVYFGLLPQFVGQGLGGPALGLAVERAWSMADARVWVHTCSLDHPAALANYKARGFRLFSEQVAYRE